MAARSNPDIDNDAETQSGGVQSVDRALQILEILARKGDAGVSEIAEEMGVHKSTVSRLVGSLVTRGWFARTANAASTSLDSASCAWPPPFPAG